MGASVYDLESHDVKVFDTRHGGTRELSQGLLPSSAVTTRIRFLCGFLPLPESHRELVFGIVPRGMVVDDHRETRCGARGGPLLERGRAPRRVIIRAEPGVNRYAPVALPPGQDLDHVVEAVRGE